MPPFNASRTKVQLKLSVQRTRMLQEKKEAIAKRARRDIASLVEKGKLETARIKTEGLIAEDIHIELLELLELYAETLLARFALLEMNTREPDPSILPAVASIIHASPRTELKELHVLREMLMAKYGRDFALDVMENRERIVPDRVTAKLESGSGVGEALVEAYIGEICKAYDVPFHSEVGAPNGVAEGVAEEEANDKANDEMPIKSNGGAVGKEASDTSGKTPTDPAPKTDQQACDDLAARFAALKRK
ncbi:Vacuolar protein sorting-associated protein ist1 [Thecaphora frezii]